MNRNISFYMKKPNYCCSLPSHSHQSQKNKKQKTLQCPEPHPRTLNFSFFTSQTTSAEANQEFCFSFISVGFSYANTPNFWGFFSLSVCPDSNPRQRSGHPTWQREDPPKGTRRISPSPFLPPKVTSCWEVTFPSESMSTLGFLLHPPSLLIAA